MTRLQLKPAKADAGLALVHDDLRQRLSTGSGLGSAELLIDHEIGNGLMVTTRTGQAAADRLKALLDELPAAIAARRATFAGRSRMCWSGDLRELIVKCSRFD